MPPQTKDTCRPNRPMQILSLGMAKTGTASMAEAYRILGYQDVHHGLNCVIDSPQDFEVFGRAADAIFPYLKTYTSRTFTRAEWDVAFGPCEAVTDIASFFGPALVEVYPEAKVVLVERDIEAWARSMDNHLVMAFSPLTIFFVDYFEPLIGSKAGPASKKFQRGWLEASNLEEARANARKMYRRHYDRIRAIVPPERLLEYRLGDGWEPLCEFLGKPVPDAEFPRINEAAEYQKLPAKMAKRHFQTAGHLFGPWLLTAAAAGGTAWLAKVKGFW